MLTYTYECDTCGKIFEYRQKISDTPLTEKPDCGMGCKLKRIITPTSGFILKGDGWYVTDFKGSKKSED